MSEFPYFAGGHTPLTAELLNTLHDQVRRQGRLHPAPPFELSEGPDGWLLTMVGGVGLWACLGSGAAGRYDWREQVLRADGTFTELADGRSGTADGPAAAAEVNGQDVPPGTVVWLEVAPGTDEAPLGYRFQAPLVTQPARTATFWAALAGEHAGRYGYIEQEFDGQVFRRAPEGRTAEADGAEAAAEANGARNLADGTVVLVHARLDANGAVTEAVFRHGASGFWALLAGATENATFLVDLGEPDDGWFTLTATASDGTTATTEAMPVSASAVEVQIALAALALPVGTRPVVGTNVLVDGEDGGPWQVEFAGQWGGSATTDLDLDVTDLVFLATPGDQAEVTLLQAGSDHPHADGAGGYGWVEAHWSASSNLTQFLDVKHVLSPKPGGRHSSWPLNKAYDLSGTANLPAGTAVVLRPGPLVDVANPDPEAVDATVPDQRYVFTALGSTGTWAVVGCARQWAINLDRPSGGWWYLTFDDHGQVAFPPTAHSTVTTVQVDRTPPSGPFSGPVNPCPDGVNPSGTFRLYWTAYGLAPPGPGVAVTAPLPVDSATATEVQAALVAAYPELAGNIVVTGGPLGTFNGFDLTPADRVLVITFTNDLANAAQPGFVVTDLQLSCGTIGAGANQVPGDPLLAQGPNTFVLPHNATVSQLYQAMAGADVAGPQLYYASLPLTSASWTLLSIEIAGLDWNPPYELGNSATQTFLVTVAGYNHPSELPTLTLHTQYLTYPAGVTPAATLATTTLNGTVNAHLGLGQYAATVLQPWPAGQNVPPGVNLRPLRDQAGVPVTAVAQEANGSVAVRGGTIVRLWETGGGERDSTGARAAVRWAFQAPPARFLAEVTGTASGGQVAWRRLPIGSTRDFEGVNWQTPFGWATGAATPHGTGTALGTRAWMVPESSGDGVFTFDYTQGNVCMAMFGAAAAPTSMPDDLVRDATGTRVRIRDGRLLPVEV